MNFPKNFLWGGASSAFQVEGASTLNKGRTVADMRSDLAKERLGIASTDVASDFYHHYKEDIQLMKECGLKAFRMSISWARIFNDASGSANLEGIQFYHDVFDELLANDIQPIVTLYHFDLPLWTVEKYNGFVSRECIDDFMKYCKLCFEEYGSKVKYWLTINEQSVITMIPAFQGLDNLKDCWQSYHHMNLANALVNKMYHEMNLGGMIGPAISYTTVYPASPDPKDIMIAWHSDDIHVFSLTDVAVYGKYPKYFINELEKNGYMFEMQDGDDAILTDPLAKPDYFGLNWYCTSVIGHYIGEDMFGEYKGPDLPRQERAVKGEYQYYKNPYTPYSEYNWNCDGIGLRYAMRKMYQMYHLPIIITENGWSANETVGEDGCIHDQERIHYLEENIQGMSDAINDGVELIGYTPWSFIDLLSASQGMDKRYGLVFVDRTNDDLKELKRIPKDSFYYYQKIIKENS